MGERDTPRVILVNPQLGENIGTAARAMANFGLHDMHLVEPRDGWPNRRAHDASAGAHSVISNAKVHDGLAGAIADLNFVYATTARPRDMIKPVMTPHEAADDMRTRAARGERTGILFGRERWGLNNDEVALADVVVMAPVDPQFASLNIAQAVLLVGYEWYKREAATIGMGTREAPAAAQTGLAMPGTRIATKDEMAGFFDHLETELEGAGFFKSKTNRPTMIRNLRNMFQRAEMSEQEVRTMRGVVSSLVRQHLRPKPNRKGQG